MRRDRLRVVIYSLLIGAVLLGLWQAAVAGTPAGKGIPGPVAVAATYRTRYKSALSHRPKP